MKKPLLSICIPTWNRSEYLRICLDSLIGQPEFFTEDVEIIISDNYSPDEGATETLGKEYAEKYENIYYFRNESCIEDNNFPMALSRANGILRKLSNDSIIYRPGSIAYMCGMARKYIKEKPHLFFLNPRVDQSYKKPKVVDFDHFMRRTSFHATWIGSFAMWDTECEELLDDTGACELKLWQVWKLCRMFEKRNAGVVLYKRFADNQRLVNRLLTYNHDQVFYTNFMTILKPEIKSGLLSRSCVKKIERDLLFDFFTNWMLLWELQISGYTFTENQDFKQRVLDIYKDKPYYRFFLIYYRFLKFLAKRGALEAAMGRTKR